MGTLFTMFTSSKGIWWSALTEANDANKIIRGNPS